MPEGWYFLETGTSPYKNTAYRANDGSSNIGDTYSYGGAGPRSARSVPCAAMR